MSNNLREIIYDPYKLMEHSIETIGDNVGVIADPGTPFALALENAALYTSGALAEMMQTYRQLYPSLAVEKQQLFNHITNNYELNTFAVPADIMVQFYINKDNIISYGIETINGYKTVLPELTKVKYGDLTFTLLNKISIVVNDNGSFVNMEPSTIVDTQRGIINKTHGVLKSTISKDGSNVEYVIFNVNMQQLEITTYTDTLTAEDVFDENIPIADNYYMLSTALTVNDIPVDIETTHSEELVNPHRITMLVKDNDDSVNLRIPMLYQYDNFISGNITVNLFTTKGKLVMSLENVDMTVEFPEEVGSIEEGTIHNITVLAYTNTVIDGGIDKRSFEEIRENIINNGVGNITIPITDYHLLESARLRGFEINKTLDTLTERLYTVTKTVDTTGYNDGIITSPLFNITVETILEDYTDSEDIIITPNYVIIKPTAIFKNVDGKVTMLEQSTKDTFITLPEVDQVEYLNDNQLFFTPYYYKVDNLYDVIGTEIYDLDNPTVLGTHVINKNSNSAVNVNSNIFNIKCDPIGYKFGINFIGNSIFEALPSQTIKARILIYSGESQVFIDGVYVNDETMVFDFESTLQINFLHKLQLLNGESLITTKFIDLCSMVKLYLYVDTPGNNSGFIQPEDIGLVDVEMLTEEQYELEFGKRLEYLWDKTLSSYTGNKFELHTIDKLLLYQEDIYEIGNDGCPVLTTVINPECNEYDPVILHHVGDVVKNGMGEDIYEYRIGDPVLVNGEPIIDQLSGVVKYTDMLAIDYKFKYSSADVYKTYIKTLLLHIKRWFELDLTVMNTVTLDQTRIKYIPSRNISHSKLHTGGYIVPVIYPKITIYINGSERNTLPSITSLKNGIGEIFSNIFSYKHINMEDIRQGIKDKYNFVIGIRIENVFDDDEVIKIVDGYSLPYLTTVINRTGVVSYNIDINIEEVDG